MDLADRLELHELPGRYGDAIDDRAWDRLDDIFTTDAVFDLTDLGGPSCEGLAEIKRFMDEDAEHPRTHTMTNIYVDETSAGVQLRFRRQGGHGVVLRRRGQDACGLAGAPPGRHAAPSSVGGTAG